METKEQIWSKHHTGVYSDCVSKPMDEFAESVAIDFANWKAENDWNHSIRHYIMKDGKIVWIQAGREQVVTSTELYQLYLQSKK